MSHEIELKLALSPQSLARLDTHPLLAACDSESVTLDNRYFDTPDAELESARVALRVRQAGTQRLQTVKTAAASQGGLSRRNEWEWPTDQVACTPDGLDLAGLRELDLPPLADIDLEGLAPVFSTDFERRLWRYRPAPSSGDEQSHGEAVDIEIALDQGRIEVGEKTLEILELELELKAGDPEALWTLARELCESPTPLNARLANHSKASRANALRHGWPAPQAIETPTLDDIIDAVDQWQDGQEPRWLNAAIERLDTLRVHASGHAGDETLACIERLAASLAAGEIPWQSGDWLALHRVDLSSQSVDHSS